MDPLDPQAINLFRSPQRVFAGFYASDSLADSVVAVEMYTGLMQSIQSVANDDRKIEFSVLTHGDVPTKRLRITGVNFPTVYTAIEGKLPEGILEADLYELAFGKG